MLGFRGGARGVEPDDRLFGQHRADRGDAELDRLLYRQVHSLAGGNGLHQGHPQGRLALHVAPLAHLGFDPLARRDEDPRVVLAAAAVEQDERLAGAQPEDVGGVVRRARREREPGAGLKRVFDVQAQRSGGLSSHAMIFAW